MDFPTFAADGEVNFFKGSETSTVEEAPSSLVADFDASTGAVLGVCWTALAGAGACASSDLSEDPSFELELPSAHQPKAPSAVPKSTIDTHERKGVRPTDVRTVSEVDPLELTGVGNIDDDSDDTLGGISTAVRSSGASMDVSSSCKVSSSRNSASEVKLPSES